MPIPSIQLTEQTTCWSCGNALPEQDGFCLACLWKEIVTVVDHEDATQGDAFKPAGPVPGHELLRELARGGMGVVYLARQKNPLRDVAVKMLLPWQMDAPTLRARFQLEAEALSLLDHPAILPLYQVGSADGVPWFSMKLVTGGTLTSRRASYAGHWREIAMLVATLADAVAFAHERGVLHRDLKPSNVLFDESGRPYLADFGLAKLLDQVAGHELTQSASLMGTPQYLAPEVAESGAAVATTASDIYGLGALLYELLAQRPPFSAQTLTELLRMVRQDLPPPINGKTTVTHRTLVPRDLEVITRKCLSKAPATRYASAHDLAADLRAWLDGQPISAQPTTVLMRLKAWSRRRPALAASIAVLVLSGIAASGAQWRALQETRGEQREAEALVAFLNGELTDKLAETGRLDLASGIHSKLAQWYETHPGRNEPEFLYERARFLYNRARAQHYVGKWEEATASLQEAITLAEPLTSTSAKRLVADSWQMLGTDVYPLRNLPLEARQARDKAGAKLLALMTEFPGQVSWRLQLANLHFESAYNAIEENESDEAKNELCMLEAVLVPLRIPNPKPEWRAQFSQLDYGRGMLAAHDHRDEDAVNFLRKRRESVMALAHEQPLEPRWQEEWAIANSRLADMLIKKADTRDEAIEAWRSATLITKRLVAADPVNAKLLRTLIRVEVALGKNLADTHPEEATTLLAEAANLTATRLQNPKDPSGWLVDASDAFQRYTRHLQAQGKAEEARVWWEQLLQNITNQFNGSYVQVRVAYQVLLEACEWERSFADGAAVHFAQDWQERCETFLAQPNQPAAQQSSWTFFQASTMGIQAWHLKDSAPEQALPLWKGAVRLDDRLAQQWDTEPGRLRSMIKLKYYLSETAAKVNQPTEIIDSLQKSLDQWRSAPSDSRTAASLEPLLDLAVLASKSTDRTVATPLVRQAYLAGLALKQSGDAISTLQKFLTL